ncbi:MAG: inositol monophosphatase [Clostridia bacterium]|nr:inositol monophosphatase [Clostridia bacterium]
MEWQAELEMAVCAAKAAGDKLKELQNGCLDIISEYGKDIKLGADREAESMIIQTLTSNSRYPVLAEESGEHGKIDGDEPVWIIDPLDGTFNYSRNIPLCCVSIALWKGKRPILGVINNFNTGEIYTGIVGVGAWCNDKMISVSQIQKEEAAVLVTGFPVNRDFGQDSLMSSISQIKSFKKIRMLGTAALSLAYVACGYADTYIEENIMFWDVAAGIALVEAAGGWISFKDSVNKKWAKDVICSSFRIDSSK